MDRTTSSTSVFAAFVAALIMLSIPFAASASDDEHRQEDIAKHRQIAQAHEIAARCLQSGGKSADCHSQLQKACKGIAVGDHCGLRTRAGEYRDNSKHIADHQTMAKAHTNAAICLEGSAPHSACEAALKKDCGGVGVGKYCGLRHGH